MQVSMGPGFLTSSASRGVENPKTSALEFPVHCHGSGEWSEQRHDFALSFLS